MSGEDIPTMIARVLRQRGGVALVVGGGVRHLKLEHPQVLLWDDEVISWERRAVPDNARFILWTDKISHAKAQILAKAAKKRRAIKFPLVKVQALRDMLHVVINPNGHNMSEEEITPAPTPAPVLRTHDVQPPALPEPEMTLRKPKRGEMMAWLPSVMGTDNPRREAERLMPIVLRKGIKMTYAALEQAVRYSRINNPTKPVAATEPAPVAKLIMTTLPAPSPPLAAEVKATTPEPQLILTDDFSDAEKMLKDAQAAIALLIELIPKLRKETAELREYRAKVRALLENKL
jgi:hypothetical protein